jgi:hypothetical protein
MLFNNRFNIISSVSAFVIFAIVSIFYGCSSDSTTNTTSTADPNVVSYESVDIDFLPSSVPGIDLYLGKFISTNTGKDVAVISGGLSGPPFYFQSGDISGGLKTGFYLVDSTISQSGYESISTVPAWGSAGATIVDTADFLSHSNTMAWGTLGNPTAITPVYGFYLAGKFANGTTTSKIFGLLHVNSISGGGATAIKINVSIKYNKAGLNKF